MENALKNRITGYPSGVKFKNIYLFMVELNELSKSISYLSLTFKISFYSDCKNRKGDVKCTSWKKSCTKKRYVDYMKKNCKKTCNHCGTVY